MSDTLPKNTKVTNKVNQHLPLTVSGAAADNNIVPGSSPDTLSATNSKTNIVPGSSPDTLSATYSKTATTLKIKKHVPGTSRDTIVTKTVPGTIKVTGKHKPGSKP